MRILILGGDGMLGHQLLQSLGARHEVKVTLRQALPNYVRYRLFDQNNAFDEFDAGHSERLWSILADYRPQVVINAIGIVKQRDTAKELIPSLEINSLLPHKLALIGRATGARLVHISTDCVFSGRHGGYTEQDIADAEDIYGRTKYLGEVHDDNAITLRTSIIGLELKGKKSLIEWFLDQKGKVPGFRKAIYSGLTTQELARVIERLIVQFPELSGLWHVASEPISKYDLLKKYNSQLGRKDVELIPDDEFECDRSLSARAFESKTGYRAPAWDEMLTELAVCTKLRDASQ